MAVTFVAAGSFAGNATLPTQAITAPSCSAGDILIACLINKSATANTISPPDATWEQIVQDVNDCTTAADDHEFAIFWKRATGSGGSFTFTKAVDDNVLFGGIISAWAGAEANGGPLDATLVTVTKTAGAADNVTFPAYNPKHTNAHVIYVAFYGNDQTTFAAAMSADTNPDCTLRFDVEDSTGNDCSIACISGDSTDGSNIASRTWASNSTTDAGNTGVVFALNPTSGAPYHVETGTQASGSGDVTPTMPSHAAGDILLLFVASSNQSAAAPSGWAEFPDSPQGTGTAGAVGSAGLNIFWKRAASGAESAPTVTDTGNNTYAVISSFRGCVAAGDPFDVTAGDVLTPSGTTVTIPGDTTTGNGRLIVAVVAHGIDLAGAHISGWTNADLADLKERHDNAHQTNNGSGIGVATGRLSQTGAYGATTATLDTTSLQARISIALKPGYALTCDTGVFTMTGVAAGLKVNRKITAAAGSFALTGVDAALKIGRKITAATGAFTLTGITTGLLLRYTLPCATGVYTLTGVNAGLKAGYKVTGGTGEFVLTGNAAILKAAYLLSTSAGAFALTGNPAGLKQGLRIALEPGQFVLTGVPVDIDVIGASEDVYLPAPKHSLATLDRSTFSIKAGNTLPDVVRQIFDVDSGTAVDLTGCTVQFRLFNSKTSTTVDATVLDAINGQIRATLTSAATAVAGDYIGEFIVTHPDGRSYTAPTISHLRVSILGALD